MGCTTKPGLLRIHTEFSFCHWLSSAVLTSSVSFLIVGFLVVKNTFAALGTESHVIRTSSPQKDEPVLLESCQLCHVLMPLGIMVYAGPSPVSYTHLDVYKRQRFNSAN